MSIGPGDGNVRLLQADVPEGTPPVIAVFGGLHDPLTLKAAEQVGYQIGLNDVILLTGGNDPAAGDLKSRVLAGAQRARMAGARAPWMAVVRAERALEPELAADGLSLVLTPGGGHLRNYVEAELCDAAIAFGGEQGTSSEVVFCLALGKPVVLVGTRWLSKYPVVSGASNRQAMKEEAQHRVPARPEHPRLGQPIARAYELFDRVVEPSFRHVALPPETAATALVTAAVDAADARGYPDEPARSLSLEEAAAIRRFRGLLGR